MIDEADYKQITDILHDMHGTAWEFICYHEMQVYSFDAETTKKLALFLYDAYIGSSASDFNLTEAGNYIAENQDKLMLYSVAPDDLYDLYTGYKDIEDFKMPDEILTVRKPRLEEKIVSAKADKADLFARNEKNIDKNMLR